MFLLWKIASVVPSEILSYTIRIEILIYYWIVELGHSREIFEESEGIFLGKKVKYLRV